MNSTQGPKAFTSTNAPGENNFSNNKQNSTATRRDASSGAATNSYLQNNSNSNQLGRVQVPGMV
jgi:hypothetical protein